MNSQSWLFALFGLQFVFLLAGVFWLIRRTKGNDPSQALQDFEQRFQNVIQSQVSLVSDQMTLRVNDQLEKTKGQFALQQMEIQNTVTPLKAKLDEYQKQFFEIEKQRATDKGSLFSELEKVSSATQGLSSETRALKDALKKPHIRGRWGEVQLKNCVEIAGMSEHCDLNFQSSFSSDEQVLRPDMIVRMPNSRVVIVDAKTPLDAFIASLEATNDVDRRTQLERHGRQVKDHIKKLSLKSYPTNLPEAADFTILFLPNESFLYAALETEPDIIEFGIDKKILIASPPTLIGMLKAIRYGWSEKKLADNAQAIALTGQELHKRLSEMVEAFLAVGSQLDRSKAEFEKAWMRLNNRVLPQAQKLEELGAKSPKDIASASHPSPNL